MPKTCSYMKFLMFEHLLIPLFQHLEESVPPFLSVKVDKDLVIETLKISKHQRVPSLKMRIFFFSNFTKILYVEPIDHKDSNFEYYKKNQIFQFLPNTQGLLKIFEI